MMEVHLVLIFPWFIEMSGLASFPTVNCNNLSVKSTKIKAINEDYGYLQVGITTEQMIYLIRMDVIAMYS